MSFQRYLSAKRTVDERALNRRVEARLAEAVADRDRLRVLEIGAGIGAMAVRLLNRPWLPDRTTYTGIEARPANVAAARRRVPERAAGAGYVARTSGDRIVATRKSRRVDAEFVVGDAFALLAETDRRWDLLIAHAFVDLADPREVVDAFREALAPGGAAYCPITFDGGTIFEPVADRGFEDQLAELFHRHLDASGDSRAGRHLLSAAAESGSVLAAGGSDWVVRPHGDAYPADEAYFLRYIVDTVADAVAKEQVIDPDRLRSWADRRRDQIEEAKLVYCAHQLDVLFR
ncbi:class I SAM-dependent methyltransferase [Halobacteriales archaeon QS_1_67_19]|nr:MAG: class I SAM-dependent methyltransferase [Halobacteriales archaeon QS_1_67_19]